MKKLIKITTLFLFFLIFCIKPAKAQEENKEVVFAVDRSMYKSEDELKDIKDDILKLSQKLIEEGKYISVIAFNDGADLLVKDTKDFDQVKEGFKDLKPLGFSNPAKALDFSNKINIRDERDIILFTSFYPNTGKLENAGPFGPNDHLYFRNANYFNKISGNLPENTSLITVGDFKNLSSKDYNFAKNVFTKSSDNFIDSENLSDIKPVIYDYINNNYEKDQVATNPIIFVPGIAGSELFVTDEDKLDQTELATGLIKKDKKEESQRIWLPLGYDQEKINEDLNISSNLYGLQEGDLRFSKIDTNQGPMALYGSLIYQLKRNFPQRPIYLFSYDWRRPNSESAEKLNNFIDTINENGQKKVDIVAHSMGGLVSAHLLKDNDDKVEKYISFGTPYEGAPKAFNEMSNENILGGFVDIVLNRLFGIEMNVAQGFEGIVELYPTRKMLEKYPYQIVFENEEFENILDHNYTNFEDFIDYANTEGISQSLKSNEAEGLMEDFLGNSRYMAFKDNANSYRQEQSDNLDVLLKHRENSLFLVGNGVKTAVSGYYQIDDEGNLSNIKEITTDEGDMLVPLYSATMGEELDEMDEDTRSKFRLINGDHLSMLLDLDNLNIMVEFLSGR